MSERDPGGPSEFERQATQATPGLVSEMTGFIRQSGKWWLIPVVLALAALGVFVVLSETAVAPFIYALF